MDLTVAVGPVNTVNTCCINAVLQSLFQGRYVVNFIAQHGESGPPLMRTLLRSGYSLGLLNEFMSKNKYDPSAFITQCAKIDFMWNPDHQQDACDFIEFVISRTALTPLFSFEQVWHVECSKYGVPHQKSQTGTVLRLTSADYFKSAIPIEEMLYHNSLMIPRCDQDHKHPETKWKIHPLPDGLCIQLPRFTTGPKHSVRDDRWFKFSQYLNLPLVDSHEAEHRPAFYNLYAVVSHYGTANAGHYISYVRRGSDSGLAWFEFDDTEVKPVSFDKVNTNNAYLLLYSINKIPTSFLEPFPTIHKTSSQPAPPAESADPQTGNSHAPFSGGADEALQAIADIDCGGQDEEDEEEEHVSLTPLADQLLQELLAISDGESEEDEEE